jgi:hypothetical protein
VIAEGELITVTMSEDGDPQPFALTLHGSDAEASPLTWSVGTQAEDGTASVTAGPGLSTTVSYAPDENHFGYDQFVVEVTDGLLTDTATISVSLEAVNDAPVGVNDGIAVVRDAEGSVSVLTSAPAAVSMSLATTSMLTKTHCKLRIMAR